jgi:uncharacterized protein YjeT (DUF2065 family)
MENQTFLVIGGLGIVMIGLAYILSPELARKMFYHSKWGLDPIIP